MCFCMCTCVSLCALQSCFPPLGPLPLVPAQPKLLSIPSLFPRSRILCIQTTLCRCPNARASVSPQLKYSCLGELSAEKLVVVSDGWALSSPLSPPEGPPIPSSVSLLTPSCSSLDTWGSSGFADWRDSALPLSPMCPAHRRPSEGEDRGPWRKAVGTGS